MNKIRTESDEVIRDLLAERSLSEIYLTSRKIPFSSFNNGVGLLFGICGAVQSFAMDNEAALKQISSIATLVFNSTISLLGFLLAGFTFFATVADKRLFCQMAIAKHESGLSYLKYNLFLFMRVFVEFLTVCIFSLFLIIFLGDGTGVRLLLPKLVGSGSMPPLVLNSLTSVFTGILIGVFAYLLMQLKSFIFNICHVVMTSIAWEVGRIAKEMKSLESTEPSEDKS
jgi:hypothetical protein